MSITNFTRNGTQTKTFEELQCSSSLMGGLQTLVSLSGNNRSLGWSRQPASRCFQLDVYCSRTLDSLSIRNYRGRYYKPRIMWGVFVDNDGHKRGQTSRPVIGAEIQTYCYFEAHIYRRRYLLGSIQCRCFMLHFRSPYNHLVWPYSYTIMSRDLNCVLHKNFLRSESSSYTNTRSCSTTAEPTKCNEYHTIQKGSVQCTVGSVGISCLLFAVPLWFSGNCDQTKQNIFIAPSNHRGCSIYSNLL